MEQEKLIDLQQQKIILFGLNKELKNKVGLLENQRDSLVDVLASVSHKPPVKTSKRQIRLKPFYVTIVVGAVISVLFVATSFLPQNSPGTEQPLKTRYLVENLKGDSVDTWKFWKLDSESTLVVNIVNAGVVDGHKIGVIKNAILSADTITVDDSLTHKGPVGTYSTYFVGWQGALEEASGTQTQYTVPTRFKIVESDSGIGNIVIMLSSAKDQDGYSGFTKSTVEGNEILKSHITIYDAGSLSDGMLASIVRHEFGHAIGLGHSTAPEDLMAPTIDTPVPYISECDVMAVSQLYDGLAMGRTVCDK